jgi:DNA-binding transcriptional MerR regulator
MSERERTYTMEELEAESGFDRRTVSYYVQEELLPRVGRRGPRTRYPRRFLERLLFVRRVRDLQDKGELPPLTLAEIKEILDRLPPEVVAEVASGKEDITYLVLGAGDAAGVTGLARLSYEHPLARSIEQGEALETLGMTRRDEEDVEETVVDLLDQAARSREEDPSGDSRWTTLSVTEDVLLTVRGDRPGVLRLAEKLAQWLRERRDR